ncbi:MAG: hypothetical protein E6Q73_15030 [Pseudorhodobacter sp.]|nr:MAG: hypothetical protein E6Q73_15030 [Pseudorhodobacter sp.]
MLTLTQKFLDRAAQRLIAPILALLALGVPNMANAEANAAPPVGYQIYCLRNPEQCQGGGASAVRATQASLQEIARVNSAVNHAIRPRSDSGADVWSAGTGEGDCEDYVLTKRQELIARGYPPSALRIAYVKTRSGEGHAVLVVRTDQGDLTLDNLSGSVRKLTSTGYNVVSMSGSDPLVWNR